MFFFLISYTISCRFTMLNDGVYERTKELPLHVFFFLLLFIRSNCSVWIYSRRWFAAINSLYFFFYEIICWKSIFLRVRRKMLLRVYEKMFLPSNSSSSIPYELSSAHTTQQTHTYIQWSNLPSDDNNRMR